MRNGDSLSTGSNASSESSQHVHATGSLSNPGRVVVSGASGFVGSAVLSALAERHWEAIGLVRPKSNQSVVRARYVSVEDLAIDVRALEGARVFVHLVARTHSADLRNARAEAVYRQVNVDLTMQLARACERAGVARFLFLSSVKAGGERTNGAPLRETDAPRPEDLYGATKLEAEDRLLEFGARTGMEVIVLRPPLVYGPGVKANFLRLMQWVRRGVPLPFAAVTNRRSMIGLSNLVDAILFCSGANVSAGSRFYVSDGVDLSTAELIRMIATEMGVRANLLAVPPGLMRGIARILGRGDLADRLLGDLQVDISSIRAQLGWKPVSTPREQMVSTVDWFWRTYVDSDSRRLT